MPGKSRGQRTLAVYSPCIYACLVVSVVSDSVTPWAIAYQAALPMGFPRQEYWSGVYGVTESDMTEQLTLSVLHLVPQGKKTMHSTWPF